MRRTIVVHTRLAGHMVRVEGARASVQGLQILTMGQLAARLAGGFLAPIDQDSLRDAVRDALADTTSISRRRPSHGCKPWQPSKTTSWPGCRLR